MRQIFSVLSCSVGVCKDRTNLDSFLNVYYCPKLSYVPKNIQQPKSNEQLEAEAKLLLGKNVHDFVTL